ncbi:MAG TPA: PilT/PilU family type 4a pilus ATPase [Candidatus Xenobia bacterium]
MAGSGKPFDFNQFLSSMKMQKGEEAPAAPTPYGVPTARMPAVSAQTTAQFKAEELPAAPRQIPAPIPAAPPPETMQQTPAPEANAWPQQETAQSWEAQGEAPQAEGQWPQEGQAQGQWENQNWQEQAPAQSWEGGGWEQQSEQGWSENQWTQQPGQEWPQQGHEQQQWGQEQQWQGGDWSGGEQQQQWTGHEQGGEPQQQWTGHEQGGEQQQQWTGHEQAAWGQGGHPEQQQWGPETAQWEQSETGWEQHSGWSEGQQQQQAWPAEQSWEPEAQPQARPEPEPAPSPAAQWAPPAEVAPPVAAPEAEQPWAAPTTRTSSLSVTPTRRTLTPEPEPVAAAPAPMPEPPAAPAPVAVPAPVAAPRIEARTPAAPPAPAAEARPAAAPTPAVPRKKPAPSRITGVDPAVVGKMIRTDLSLQGLLEQLVAVGGSDLHLSAGVPPCYRLKGDMVPQNFAPLTAQEIEAMLFPVMSEEQRAHFEENSDLDFAMELPGLARFRVNFARQYRGMLSVMRIIPREIPNLAQLGLPAAIDRLCRTRRGMVIVTGPTGSGKSTTLAAMINEINQQRQAHIITIEDPIEFVHDSKKCLITHREIGQHAVSFADAIRAAVREDPDIILVGEMRDLDTVSQAVKAAEMGLLVLATLHTNNAAKAVDRIIDIFPAEDQEQIRVTLSEALKGVVAQQLLKKADGKGRVAVHEILIGTPALSNLIRDAKTHQIPGVIQTGRDVGMQLMDQGLIDLIQKGLITPEIAREKATDYRNFQRAGINL